MRRARPELHRHAQLNALRTELMIWRALETAVREPIAVYATTSSGGMFNVRVALRQRVPGEARNAIVACLGALANIKNVFVVDADIDIFSDAQMDWAMATRFQPDRDLLYLPACVRCRSILRSPVAGSVPRQASISPGRSAAERLEARVPEPPRFDDKRFSSVEAALADGAKFFAELMAAVGSRDGREIVRTLDRLRETAGLDRGRRRALPDQRSAAAQRSAPGDATRKG